MLRIAAVRANEEGVREVSPAELPALLADEGIILWIDAGDPVNEEAVRIARDVFHFHPIALEDCFEVREHPKVEGFEDYLFVTTHGLTPGSTAEETETIELDAFLGQRYLFTYHERPSRSVEAAWELVARNRGGPLRRGPATVLHAILNRQVDGIAPVLDGFEQRLEEIEDRVIAKPTRADLITLLALKRSTLQLRRWMSKQREVVLRLSRNEFPVVGPADAVMFRDVYDHLQRFTDFIENDREMISSLQETYLSITNLRLGEIMKFLTLFTAVLMPLTVITGIYGMNFDHMPELRWPWGYPLVLGLMAITSLSIAWFFRRRGWLGRDNVTLPGPPGDPPPG